MPTAHTKVIVAISTSASGSSRRRPRATNISAAVNRMKISGLTNCPDSMRQNSGGGVSACERQGAGAMFGLALRQRKGARHNTRCAASSPRLQQAQVHRPPEPRAVGAEMRLERGPHFGALGSVDAVIGKGGVHHAALEFVEITEVHRHLKVPLGHLRPGTVFSASSCAACAAARTASSSL